MRNNQRLPNGIMITKMQAAILAGVALTVMLIAVVTGLRVNGQMGFPLDDAWIHQTYARNFGQLGEWAYRPGELSAGSTAPLWTFLLSPGYWLGSPPAYGWTLAVSWLGFFSLGGLVETMMRLLTPAYRPKFPWAGVIILLEWHQVWAAVSGMETGWMATLDLLVFALILVNRPVGWFLAGVTTGLAVWLRPDSIALLGPLFFVGGLQGMEKKTSWRWLASALAGFAVLFAAYLLFNLRIGGAIWPNTLFAKQAEYQVMTHLGLGSRIANLFVQPLIGVGVTLLPGFGYGLWKAFRARTWAWLAMVLWWAGVTLIYALRLPVTYQHGRYLMPSMPIFILLGISGTWSFFAEPRAYRWIRKELLTLATTMIIGLVTLAFFGLGIQAYQRDTAVINSEMVATAHWIAENLSAEDVLAAHDIGAIGFYTENPIVDLAGLISPAVIPFIRDEDQLGAYMDAKRVDYLVTFPGWYTELNAQLPIVYQSTGEVSPELGGENMTVYAWSAQYP